MLLQLAAAAPFPASLTPGDAVAALGGAGRLVDGAGDAVLCKTLALVDAFGARALVVLVAGKSLAPGRLPGFRLAPPAELRPLFGFDKGTLGPAGGHGGATVLVDRPLAGRDVSLGCGDAATRQSQAATKHGLLTYQYANCPKYVGDFENGMMHGQGRFTMADGVVLDGAFLEDEWQGA